MDHACAVLKKTEIRALISLVSLLRQLPLPNAVYGNRLDGSKFTRQFSGVNSRRVLSVMLQFEGEHVHTSFHF